MAFQAFIPTIVVRFDVEQALADGTEFRLCCYLVIDKDGMSHPRGGVKRTGMLIWLSRSVTWSDVRPKVRYVWKTADSVKRADQ